MTILDDGEIIRRMRRGDVTGVEGLLHAHGPRVKASLRLRFGLGRGDHALEDAVHDAALIMYQRARRLDAKRNLGGYLMITAGRELARALEQCRTGSGDFEIVLENVPVDERRESTTDEFSLALRRLLDELPDREREILAIDHGSDFKISADRIAEELGTTRHTVYVLRHRTRQRIEEFCEEWGRVRATGGDA